MDDLELENVKPLHNIKKEAILAGKQPMGIKCDVHLFFGFLFSEYEGNID